ncbi:hypothetical protein F477_03586 [Pseudomonas sp. URIL14HWK12:I3]|uniref:hypothetical protein n=1 Tax=unclassified Pseudomonas TaxID=196821 RepID=UPI000DAE769A|nr:MULTISPECIES: hypothetical protein [unclassified Pseudomonas]PZW52740.1 hypothetical protein F478_02535 [Pseudomonas sp. URIL14HWK12:I2]PZW53485.1 hypothetical protein F477_03586 [Pseudomonas sp. URIL14HWK12:I3]
MSILDTYHCLRDAVHILATSSGDVKFGLFLAMTNKLIMANIPPDPELPEDFSKRIESVRSKLTVKECNVTGSILATLNGMHSKTASQIAEDIWFLYTDIENFVRIKNEL